MCGHCRLLIFQEVIVFIIESDPFIPNNALALQSVLCDVHKSIQTFFCLAGAGIISYLFPSGLSVPRVWGVSLCTACS